MDNLTALGELLNSQMQRVQAAGATQSVEFGVIQEDLSLRVDSLKDDIPKGEYLLNLSLTGLTGDFLVSSVDGTHPHSHTLPAPLRGIRPNDRVLVLWVGNQPVVLAILASSKDVNSFGR